MNDIPLIIILVFILISFLAWLGITFGSKWFRLLQEKEASKATTELENMFIFTGSEKIILLNITILIVAPILTLIFTGNLILVTVSTILAFFIPRKVLKIIAEKRLRKIEEQLPDAILMMVGALRSGSSLINSLESIAQESKPPLSQEISLFLREIRLGVDFDIALKNLENRVPIQDFIMFTSGISLSKNVGANLSETLDSIGKTVRAKLQMEGKIRSLTAQGKMQGLVMSGLPVFLIFVLNFMEPEAMAPLFNTWYGWITLAIISIAILIGHHFIKKITNIDI